MHPEPSIGLLLRSHSRERCPVLLTGTVTIGVSGMVKHPFPIMTARNPAFQRVRLSVFPEFDSVKRYAPYPEDWDIRSEVMMSHQRGGDHANGLIETYLLNEYKNRVISGHSFI